MNDNELTYNQQLFEDNIGCDPERPGTTPKELAAYQHAKQFSERLEPLFQQLHAVANPLVNFGDDGQLISGEKVDDVLFATRVVLDSQEVMSITRKIDLAIDNFIDGAKEVLDLPMAREYLEGVAVTNREVYLNAKMTASQVSILAKENDIQVGDHILKTLNEGTLEEKHKLFFNGRSTVEENERVHPYVDFPEDEEEARDDEEE